jgi:hypothetical protein
MALGARAAALLRQSVIESTVLSIAGGLRFGWKDIAFIALG